MTDIDLELGIAPPGPGEATGVDDQPPEPAFFDDEPAGDDVPHVTEQLVRPLVAAAGHALHTVAGDDDVPEHWFFTDRELDDLTPPLTRIINRRPKLRRAVMRGDELALAVVLASYAGRNVADARRAQEARNGDLEREADEAAGAGGPDHRGPATPPGPWNGEGDPRAGLGFRPPPG